jgi:hypothetical protein
MKKAIIIYFIFIAAILFGEIRCIVKAVNCNWNPIGKAEIVYTVGACTGCVIGYLNIKDK